MQFNSLPIIQVKVNSGYVRCFVDMGYLTTLVQPVLVSECTITQVKNVFYGHDVKFTRKQ